jgi:hypothetical protein
MENILENEKIKIQSLPIGEKYDEHFLLYDSKDQNQLFVIAETVEQKKEFTKYFNSGAWFKVDVHKRNPEDNTECEKYTNEKFVKTKFPENPLNRKRNFSNDEEDHPYFNNKAFSGDLR